MNELIGLFRLSSCYVQLLVQSMSQWHLRVCYIILKVHSCPGKLHVYSKVALAPAHVHKMDSIDQSQCLYLKTSPWHGPHAL